MATPENRLWDAVRAHDVNKVRRLVEKEGADPWFITGGVGWCGPIMHWLCLFDNIAYLRMLRFLVEERKVDVTVSDQRGNTLLHIHSLGSSPLAAAEILIEAGKSDLLEAKNNNGQTALHMACKSFRPTAVLFLVEKGCNVDAVDHDGRNALDVALTTYFDRPYEHNVTFHDAIRALLPHSRISDELIENADWFLFLPWDIKLTVIEKVFKQKVRDVPDNYWEKFPIHAVCQIPLPIPAAYLHVIDHFSADVGAGLDCRGRLPIRMALQTASSNGEAFTPSVLRKLFELVPRSALIRDPKTGFYPYQVIASMGGTGEPWQTLEEDLLDLTYHLVRANPMSLLTANRGEVRNGESTTKARARKRQKTMDNRSS